MSIAIVYAFAAQKGMTPVVGAPPPCVLTRQLPRMVVSLMNGGGDRGIRFFPLLGPVEGRRQFISISEMLSLQRLADMHAQKDEVAFLVDGKIQQDAITVRIHDPIRGEAGETVFQETMAFDPLDPLPVVRRMIFELSGVLEWRGTLPPLPQIPPPALSYYLVAKDDLLSLEAGFERDGEGQWLKAIRFLLEHRSKDPEVREILLDICRRLAATGSAAEEVQALLVDAVAKIE